MFSGSLRYNVDPLDEYTDEEVWNALEKVGNRRTQGLLQVYYSLHIQYSPNVVRKLRSFI